LAFSNSGGGIIIIGVEETDDKLLSSVGIEPIQDKAIISNQLKPYLPSVVNYEIHDFSYQSSDYGELIGKTFQVILVEYDPTIIPIVCMTEGKNVRENAVYVREGTSSILANYDYLQRLLNNRINTNRDTSNEIELEEHLAQLEILYSKIQRYHYVYKKSEGSSQGNWLATLGKFAVNVSNSIIGEKEAVPNPNYPEEDYEQFISRIIASKKNRIERILDI
jgi:predicted HTH transcriptional regulator